MTRVQAAVLASLALAGTVAAQDQPIRIAVLNDQSSVYADFQGRGSVLAAPMAVEDYGAKAAGRRIDVVLDRHLRGEHRAASLKVRVYAGLIVQDADADRLVLRDDGAGQGK